MVSAHHVECLPDGGVKILKCLHDCGVFTSKNVKFFK